MTAVTLFQNSDKSPLGPDDQMDLAPSPAMAADEVDFELEDAGEAFMEFSQDIILEDEPERPSAASDPAFSALGKTLDDDPMVDEDVMLDHDEQRPVPQVNIHSRQDPLVREQKDDDILYDEEGTEEPEVNPPGTPKEIPMDDDEEEQCQQQDQVSGLYEPLEDELQVEPDSDSLVDGAAPKSERLDSTTAEFHHNFSNTTESPKIDAASSPQSGSEDTLRLEHQPSPQEKSPDDGSHQGQIEAPSRSNSNPDLPKTLKVKNGNTIGEQRLQDVANSCDSETITSPIKLHSRQEVNQYDGGTRTYDGPQNGPIHPVKVHYLETEMCLFPPTAEEISDMFFLQDVSLAHESLDKMLNACRDVLADTIGDDDELVLDITSLGLHISEGSCYATEISLSQILEVYINLAHNENTSNIEPLSCILTSRVCLSSQYAYLQSAVSEGKSLTQIVQETAFTPEEDEEHDIGYPDTSFHQVVALPEVQNISEATRQDEQGDSSVKRYTTELDDGDVEPKSTNETDNRQARDEVSNGDNNCKFETENDDFQVAVSNGEKKSPLVVVKTELIEHQADDKALTGLCLKPHACSCSTCAKLKPSKLLDGPDLDVGHASIEGKPGIGDPDRDGLRLPDATTTRNTSNAQSHHNVGYKEDIIHSLEEENDLFEEDLFARGQHQAPDNTQDDLRGIQRGGVERLKLEEDYHAEQHSRHEEVPSYEDDGGDEVHQIDNTNSIPRSMLPLSSDLAPQFGIHNLDDAVTHAEREDNFLHLDNDDDGGGQEHNDEGLRPSIHVEDESNTAASVADVVGDETPEVNDVTLIHGDLSTDKLDDDPPTRAKDSSQSFLQPEEPIEDLSTKTLGERPTTPDLVQTSSKRKVLEDEEDFDLFDAGTPENKRQRPS